MPKDSQFDANETDRLRNRALTIVDFLEKIDPGGLTAQLKPIVYSTAEKGDVRGLRTILRDLTEWTASLPSRVREELEERLIEGGDDRPLSVDDEIAAILNRGAVSTPDEYRALVSYADRIYDDPTRSEELEQVNRLLAAVDQKKVR